MRFKNTYNLFYQALTILEQFESESAKGRLAVAHFALTKASYLFDSAMKQGDVLAHHFLHYIAQKYHTIDPTLLPSLDTVPEHKAQGKEWIACYKQYIALMRWLLARAEGSKLSAKELRSYKNKLTDFSTSNCPIQSLFCARIMERANTLNIETTSNSVLNQCYKEAAMYPNIWAMTEYADFLDRTDGWDRNIREHIKLEMELNLIQEHNGLFTPLRQHYLNQQDDRFASQWLMQGAMHGELKLSALLAQRYLIREISWIIPISAKDALDEAHLWLDHIFNYGKPNILKEIGSSIINQYPQFSATSENQSLQKAVFLAYFTNKFFEYFNKPEIRIPVFPLVKTMFEHLGSILNYIKENNRHNLPLLLRDNPMMCSELALDLEKKGDLIGAERFYRDTYRLAPDSVLSQYNLANILTRQALNIDEQIALYFKAAHNQCCDSMHRLFELALTKEQLSFAQLNTLRNLINSLEAQFTIILLEEEITLDSHWITNTLDYLINRQQQLYRHYFMRWSHSLDKENASPSYLKHVSKETATDSTSTEAQEPHPKQPPQEETTIETKKQRALSTLKMLSETKTRKITFKDYLAAAKCYQQILDLSMKISNKGRTSGSRVAVNGENHHLPHGADRMSPGAQHRLKESITVMAETASRTMSM